MDNKKEKAGFFYTVGDKKINFHRPLIMGIINVTPDSFYDGGQYVQTEQIEKRITQMVKEGADIIDVGAVSTRPGAIEIEEKEEMLRLVPALVFIKKHFPGIPVSIDTFRSSVADKVIRYFGPCIINDISAGKFDKKMPEVVAAHTVPYVLMHMQGIPESMQKKPDYTNVVDEVFSFLKNKAVSLMQVGVRQILIDPGFGFGKTTQHNFSLLSRLSELRETGLPVLVGISRKSMIYKLLDISPDKALNGTTALNMLALVNGADVLRVHDVRAAVEVRKLFLKYRQVKQ